MKLQFTNNYKADLSQFSRIMGYLHTRAADKKILREDLVVNLGLAERQIECLSSIMVGMGLLQVNKTSKLTPFGRVITTSDPYFDLIESLWIVHYLVSSEPEWVIWNRVINEVLPRLFDLTVQEIQNGYFSDLKQAFSEYTYTKKVPGEIKAVLESYSQSSLSRLNLITQFDNKFQAGIPSDIPASAFFYILFRYREQYFPGSSALETTQLIDLPNSPGRVLNMTNQNLRDALESLNRKLWIRIERNANLDQIRFAEGMDEQKILELIYGDAHAA